MGVYGLTDYQFLGDVDPRAKIGVKGAFGTIFKNLHNCHKIPQYGFLMTPLDPLNQFSGDSDPRGQTLGPRGQIKKIAFLSQKPTISVFMDSPGPRE